MKTIQLLIFVFCIQTISNGQSPYWTFIEPGTGWTFSFKMQATSDGGCLGMGTKHTSNWQDFYVIKFNSEGVQQWNLEMDPNPDISGGQQMATNMAELNGHYYVSVTRSENGKKSSSILKLTPDGEIVADIENENDDILDIKSTSDGSILAYYMEGDTMPKLVKLTEQGEELWERPLEYKRTFLHAYGIINQAGNYVVANYKKSEESKAIVYEIDFMNGDILQESEFDFPYNSSAEGIATDQLESGEYVICNLKNGGTSEFHLLFLDETLTPVNDIDIVANFGLDGVTALRVVEENILLGRSNSILVFDEEGNFENSVPLTIISDHIDSTYLFYSAVSIETNEQNDVLITGNVLSAFGYVHYTKLNNNLNYEFTTDIEAILNINRKSLVFPNPSSNRLSLSLSDESLAQFKYLDVIDSKGNMVLSKIEYPNDIDISQLPKGIYQVISTFENDIETIPFVKM